MVPHGCKYQECVVDTIDLSAIGYNLDSSFIPGWTVNITSSALLDQTLTLTPANSTFTVAPGRTIIADFSPYLNNLAFVLDDQKEGFEVNCDGTVGTDSFQVDWVYGLEGPVR